MTRKLPLLLGIIMLLLFFAAPPLVGGYGRYILILIFIYSIITVGLDILVGYTGQISVGAAGFFAIGAYVSTLFVIKLGIPVIFSIFIGAISAGIIGWLFGFPALKLNPIYIAAGTFGFGQLVNLIILHWEAVTNGADGLKVPRMFPSSVLGTYYLALILTVILIIAAYNLIHSRIGRAFIAIRESQVAAYSLGVNVPYFKTIAFAISSFYAGIAGGLLGQLDGFISPDSFTVISSILFLTMIIVGGVGTITGAILGAMLLTGLAQASLGYGQFSEIIFGAVLLFFLLFMPKGLVSRGAKLRELFVRASNKANSIVVDSGEVGDVKHLHRSTPLASANTNMDSLELKKISIAFGGLLAVNDFSLSVLPGKIHGVIGPNGAGKTTLFNVITGLYKPDKGEILWKGENIVNYQPNQICGAGIARTYQNIEIFEEMSVLDNVLVGMHLQQKAGIVRSALRSNLSRTEERIARDRAMDLLRFTGLYSLAALKAYDLAFWQKRRLELARALAINPSMLLLDEPAAGLSKKEVQELKDILLVLHRSRGLTIVMIEHVMELAMNICDTITVMHEGRKIAEGIPEMIKKDEAVLNAYLGTGDLNDNFKFS